MRSLRLARPAGFHLLPERQRDGGDRSRRCRRTRTIGQHSGQGGGRTAGAEEAVDRIMLLSKKSSLRIAWGAFAALACCTFVLRVSPPARAQSHPTVTHEMFDQWMTELSNWNRWGKDDQLGAVNLITPAKRKQALALVKEGVLFSLARDAETEKAVDNPAPVVHQMTRTGIS